jgi:hypothetical protein
MWAIFVVTALMDGSGDQKYTRINQQVVYHNRIDCEYALNDFITKYEPFKDNQTAWCLKVDE